ncbi:hypothetical protein Tco_0881076 [Tanacetum coccineum]
MTLEGLVFVLDCLAKVGQIHERQEQTYSMHDQKGIVSFVENQFTKFGPLLTSCSVHGHLFRNSWLSGASKHICVVSIVFLYRKQIGLQIAVSLRTCCSIFPASRWLCVSRWSTEDLVLEDDWLVQRRMAPTMQLQIIHIERSFSRCLFKNLINTVSLFGYKQLETQPDDTRRALLLDHQDLSELRDHMSVFNFGLLNLG